MIDLSEKSKEELFREKKEAELRAAKMKEGDVNAVKARKVIL